MYGVFDRFLPGNLPKWKNQSIPTNTDPMWSDLHLFVAAALQPFVRSREHKKRRCPFASTPFQVEVARRLRLGWRYPINPRVILLIGTLLWNNIKMISCIIYIYICHICILNYMYIFFSPYVQEDTYVNLYVLLAGSRRVPHQKSNAAANHCIRKEWSMPFIYWVQSSCF